VIASPGGPAAEPIDAVFTWVDDTWPGYRQTLERYASTVHDRNPNRTRDNLELLKYGLRSLAAYAPWVRRVFLVTSAPQVPAWLAAGQPGLAIVHHDRIMAPEDLPTFNSFAIVAALHRIPGLSRRFLYFEDDMLLAAPAAPAHFADADGTLRVYCRIRTSPPAAARPPDRVSPWNAALAYSNHLLDQAFGPRRRHEVGHGPLLIDRDHWDEMERRWPEPFARTRQSRFRAPGNVAPEYLYPHFLLGTGRARAIPPWRSVRVAYYHELQNVLAWSWWCLAAAQLLRPTTIALNDGFGAEPNPRVVALAKRFLERRFPVKSAFEA
jgi:hypothetical protein